MQAIKQKKVFSTRGGSPPDGRAGVSGEKVHKVKNSSLFYQIRDRESGRTY